MDRSDFKSAFPEGVRDGIPIALGYFAVSFSLGIAARNVGVTAVKFKVRTADQDWQDGVWFDASRSENGGWTCRIPLSSFNDYRGQYVARCYAYDKAGNKKSDDINVSIKPVCADFRPLPDMGGGTHERRRHLVRRYLPLRNRRVGAANLWRGA